jgi:circadian clock protein KaiC
MQKRENEILQKKPLEKRERVETLIPQLDEMIEGGFQESSTNLLVGGPGSGKTIFSTQFLMGGLKKGEKCLYITFEEKKNQFYLNMKEFKFDLEYYEKKGLFMFLEYSPVKVKTMLDEGGGAIESIVINKKISRIIIDSITSFELLFDNELEKREAVLNLFNIIKSWGCTSLLTLEEEPTIDGKISSRTLEFESDSIIVLYFIREGNERQRYIEIEKMRGTKHSKKLYKFEINNAGIEIKNPASLKI